MRASRSLPGWPLLLVGCVAWSLAAALGEVSDTTYAGASGFAHAVDAVAGLALLAAGLLACAAQRTRRLGILALLASAAWFAPAWEAAADAPSLLRSLGGVLAPFGFALAAHIGLGFRRVVAAAYVIAVLAGVVRSLFRDPLLDLYCWRNCSDNDFLLAAEPGLADALRDVWSWTVPVAAAAIVVVGVRQLLLSTVPARRKVAPLLVPGLLVGVAEGVYAVALMRTPLEDPQRTELAAVFLVRGSAFSLLALGLLWTCVRLPWLRARMARVADVLGVAPPPGRLRDALATAVGDQQLEVLYPRPGSHELIDAEGRPAHPPRAGLETARITRRGRTVALVLHDPAPADDRDLQRALGSAARLAVENEALRAEALAQLRELRESRLRVVEAGDAERRRLERNLHDGAQQRLLALSYDIRVVRAGTDGAMADLLACAAEATDAALEELRVLAHGIYPAILTEAGLAAALETLADEAPLPVEFAELPAQRHSAAVETTAYLAIADAIADAERRGAAWLSVRVAQKDSSLIVSTEDDGPPRVDSLERLSDRVGALGGRVELGERTVHAEIPCA